MENKYCLIVGRFQPLHDGHKRLIQTLLDEGKHVCIGLMNTKKDDKNPYGLAERIGMFLQEFGGRVMIVELPPIGEICYGRNPGFWVRRVYHEKEHISATDIRNGGTGKQIEYSNPVFEQAFNCVAEEVHEDAVKKGFWKKGPERPVDEVLAEMHSEISEARECFREDNPPDKNISDMTGAEVQLADVLIMLMDMAKGYGLKIAEAALRKISFNRTRPYRHGKRF